MLNIKYAINGTGKSTLLNTLTDAGVFAEDKLFATLDPTSRGLVLNDNRKILIIDTVGFIRKLPHHLIEAFKSTLEEAVIADVLIHVVDASSPGRAEQVKVVDEVLKDIGAVGKPQIAVFNKCDKLETFEFAPRMIDRYEKNVRISAKSGENINELIDAIHSQECAYTTVIFRMAMQYGFSIVWELMDMK